MAAQLPATDREIRYGFDRVIAGLWGIAGVIVLAAAALLDAIGFATQCIGVSSGGVSSYTCNSIWSQSDSGTLVALNVIGLALLFAAWRNWSSARAAYQRTR